MENKKVIELKNQLNRFVGTKKKVRIERNIRSEEYINGFIHDVSKGLVVLQQFHDFYCEGYTIIKLSDVSDLRSDEHERFFERMLNAEGLLDQIEYKRIIPITDFVASLSYFVKNNENIIIECESLENPADDEFYIGKVSEIEGNDAWFIGFSALGEWEKEEVAIKIANITRIQFNTPYINIFSKYLEEIERA